MKTKWLQEKSARNRKGESQGEGSYFCGGFGRGESVKGLQSDSKEVKKESEEIKKATELHKANIKVKKKKRLNGLEQHNSHLGLFSKCLYFL